MTIQQDLKSSAVPTLIELFQLDLSVLGGEVLYLTPHTNGNGGRIMFAGKEYLPVPITGSGWETAIDGSPPQPTLKIANVNRFAQPYLVAYDDFVGAKLTRIQTFDKYLDSGSTPDSSQVFNTGAFLIEQKTKQNKLEIEFKLSSVIDAPQFKLPRGQVLRSIFPGAGLFKK